MTFLPGFRRPFYVVLFISSTLLYCTPKQFEQPNIILIVADDLGYGDLGCYGGEDIKTPNLDSLAAKGMRFLDFHSNGAVSSPTRAALLTGRYPQRSGIEGDLDVDRETRQVGLDVQELTFVDYLKSIGYATGMVGKWHLGYRIDYNPVYQGFDYFRGFVSSDIDYHSHIDGSGIPDWWYNLEKTEEKGYLTDLITKHAVSFIEQNKDNRFCLYVAHQAAHYPYQGRDDHTNRLPGQRFSTPKRRKEKRETYIEMVEVLDESIGQITRKIQALGLEENTLILFCSDNGGVHLISDNGILKGSKGSLLEGGLRVPAIAYWPGNIPPNSITSQPVTTMDLFPTFVNLSKAKTKNTFHFDGIDITRLMLEGKELPSRTLFWKYRKKKVARNGNWKLMAEGDSLFLYDLSKDLSEKHNLINAEKDIANQLSLELFNWENQQLKGIKLKTQ